MRRIACFLTMVIGITALLALPAKAMTTGELAAETAVLIDADTGQILFEKNRNTKRHPASITKIMTGLLAVELSSPDEMATVTETAVDIPYNSTHISLTPGEIMSVDNLMYALMLNSANDAANVLAEHIDGDQAAFAKRMTERAGEIGAVNTIFVNPHGLDDPVHLTTAYDMALITREAVRNKDFAKYFGAQRHTIPPTNKQPQERYCINQQHMLLPDQWLAYNEDVIGGKVGYTDDAKHTMSTVAERDGRTLIAVVMGCGTDEKFYDTETLLAYGFDELESVPVPDGIFDGLAPTAVTRGGERVGEITYEAEAPTSLLLPAGMSADDIAFERQIPETLEEGRMIEAKVSLRLKSTPGNGVPSVLLEVPLTGSVEVEALAGGGTPPELARSLPGELTADPAEKEAGFAIPFDKWYVLLVAAIVIPTALIITRHVTLLRRRNRRIRRMSRVLEKQRRLEYTSSTRR